MLEEKSRCVAVMVMYLNVCWGNVLNESERKKNGNVKAPRCRVCAGRCNMVCYLEIMACMTKYVNCHSLMSRRRQIFLCREVPLVLREELLAQYCVWTSHFSLSKKLKRKLINWKTFPSFQSDVNGLFVAVEVLNVFCFLVHVYHANLHTLSI